MDNYTTTAIKTAVLSDIKTTEEEKKAEEDKSVISDDAYAVIDYLNKLSKIIDHRKII